MTRMKINSAVIFLFAAVMFTIQGAYSDVLAKSLNYSSILPDGSPGFKETREYFQTIYRKTGGEVSVKVYGGGVAGDDYDVVRKMKVNRVDFATVSGVGLGAISPGVRVLEAPGLFRNPAEIAWVISKAMDMFAADFEQEGFVLLGIGDGGKVFVYSKKNMTGPEGLAALNIWTWKGDPIAQSFFQDMGMKTTPLHLQDVARGMQSDMIDSIYTPPVGCLAYQWYTQVHFKLDYTITNVMGGLVMNKKTMDQLSPEHQKIIREESRRLFDVIIPLFVTHNKEAEGIIAKAGVVDLKPSPAQVESYKKSFETSISRLISAGLISRERLDLIRGLVWEYRSRHPE